MLQIEFYAGSRMTDHVISNFHTMGSLECSMRCLKNLSVCKSINYKTKNYQLYSENCQLNNATKMTHPKDLLADRNYDFFQLVEKVSHA